ncbi:nitroreductase family protein [Spirochaeta isovalerica]|uniref:Nitroreductase n=1 Tax=Spirochaeta isovalerica TaxID=150 RepID=A0A841RCD6_9SPIO|nr:nitroreductase family protein [Spirochaeta isovalerica]MBB6480062.1 nitroreductase [Spirochaeta isovalerica]
MNSIFERRSVNFFDPSKDIDDELLKNIIDLASTAPSAFNLQPWDIIAVKTPEAKEKLLELTGGQSKVQEAPVTLIVIGNRAGYDVNNPVWKQLEAAMGKEKTAGARTMAENLYGSTEERKIKFAESNAGLLSMSIMYAARHYGVDSHPMSGIDFEGIKKEFDLGEEKDVVMLISLGYFDGTKELYPRAPRRAYEDLVVTV